MNSNEVTGLDSPSTNTWTSPWWYAYWECEHERTERYQLKSYATE